MNLFLNASTQTNNTNTDLKINTLKLIKKINFKLYLK